MSEDIKQDKLNEKETNEEVLENTKNTEVEDTNESIDTKNDEINNELEKQVAQMKELAQRTQAEFMNYKKRVAKEKQDLTVFANEKIVMEMLLVLDNFQRALDSEKDNETAFYQGVVMIKKQLEDVLAKNGLEEIVCLNEDFDPNYHHAVMQVEGEESNKIVEVLQKGYKLKDKVIRPAMVKVSM